MSHSLHPPAGSSRRAFLADTGMGFTGIALSSMLFRDGKAQAAVPVRTGSPLFQPRAKSVIWIFLIGGASHLESFDPKPMLNKYAGKSIDETPFKDITDPRRINEILLQPGKDKREVFK